MERGRERSELAGAASGRGAGTSARGDETPGLYVARSGPQRARPVMGETTGFMKYDRELPTRRPIPVRVLDWKEVYEDFPPGKVRIQGARCMDCGIPFCHTGCPLGNLIPEWNDLVYRDQWQRASERLHATNNFPEFTGRLCPAPCEAACVLSISEQPGPVAIKRVEWSIAENGWAGGHVASQPASVSTGRRVAVVG